MSSSLRCSTYIDAYSEPSAAFKARVEGRPLRCSLCTYCASSHCKLLCVPLPAASPPTVSKTKLRPAVPTKDEKPVMGLTSNKNFITANAVEAILAKPKNVPQEEFQWTMKPDYGKVPMYLRRNKARVAAEREHVEQYLKLREEPVSCSHCSQACIPTNAYVGTSMAYFTR